METSWFCRSIVLSVFFQSIRLSDSLLLIYLPQTVRRIVVFGTGKLVVDISDRSKPSKIFFCFWFLFFVFYFFVWVDWAGVCLVLVLVLVLVLALALDLLYTISSATKRIRFF
ncbi:hypothetical protein IWZ03DRAFT_376197 [Phyllosticta citriasiana]|uniref:Transmembrane protein n=1 Tax=Phyllosticta citriasiana TaxID=595635 RepID=A0ABR1KLS7_9PEZI